ncbi:hypothetical protein GB928_025080 [Shinella curvata]|uniref:Uncharacterized protein n=1 Tax=Shinella curvata TaxID=1817964 RepID=A0ABT8XL63_9HYPH|nr:hypothetical protein [Shinella curvata]MCJ8056689.1 hypothetical protein [Shinella curvata]MDO6124471.1 hypothetical protein [Shinella curvata]
MEQLPVIGSTSLKSYPGRSLSIGISERLRLQADLGSQGQLSFHVLSAGLLGPSLQGMKIIAVGVARYI